MTSPNRKSPQGDAPEPDDVPSIYGQVPEDARSRTSMKKERVNNETALSDLVRDLLPLSEERWLRLGLSEETLDTLRDSRKVTAHGARGRHLRLIRATLRDADWASIRRNLDRMLAGYVVTAETSSEARTWTERLIVQGDAAISEFVHTHEHADRKRLRTLVRNVTSASETKRAKARALLERAVTSEVGRIGRDGNDGRASDVDEEALDQESPDEKAE